MGPSYRILTFDLTLARDRVLVSQVAPGARYTAVKVLECPSGAGVELAFGASAENVPAVLNREFSWLDACGHPYGADEGLLLTHPAGAGTLKLLIGFENAVSVT